MPLLITWGQEIEENLRPKLIEWITKRQRQLEYLLLVTLDSTWLAWHCWWIMNLTFITRHQTYGKCHKALEHWRPTYVAKYKAITEKMAVVAPSHLVEEEEEAAAAPFFFSFFHPSFLCHTVYFGLKLWSHCPPYDEQLLHKWACSLGVLLRLDQWSTRVN